MYRVFCESYDNYVDLYDTPNKRADFRYIITKPFELIRDVGRYQAEQAKETLLYKQLCDLLFYMTTNIDRYPKMRAFLWTLESRGMKAQYYGIVPEAQLEEQTKLANSFLSLLYWDSAD
jgi:hypothetical protein